jgi:hypothetical protein
MVGAAEMGHHFCDKDLEHASIDQHCLRYCIPTDEIEVLRGDNVLLIEEVFCCLVTPTLFVAVDTDILPSTNSINPTRLPLERYQ